MIKKVLLATTLLTSAPALAQNIAVGDVSIEEGGKAQVPVTNTGAGSATAIVTFYTGAPTDTAVPGIDYTGVAIQFSLPPRTKRLVDVQTIDNATPGPGKTISTKLVVNRGGTLRDGTGKITIADPDVAAPPPPPPPPPVPCPDGTTVPAGQTCPLPPPPPPVVCPDGTTLPAGSTCPVVPPPPPPPTAHRDNVITYAGDSQNVTWANTTPGGNWTNVYRATRTGKGLVAACPIAVSGRVFGSPTDANGLNNPTEIAKVDECNGEVVVFVPSGSNDGKPSWNLAWTPDTWLARAFMWADTLTAKGYKVAIGTILPQGMPTDPTFLAKQNAFRKEANTKLVAQAPAHKVTVIDLRTDTVLDADNAPLNAGLYNAVDQLHLTACSGPDGPEGQCRVYRAAAPVLDALLGINGSVIVPPPPPPALPPPAGFVEAPVIPSNFDVSQAIYSTNVIPPLQPDSEHVGAFRFICGAGQLSYDDPIVYPGQPGKSHLHQYFGNLAADANSTFESLRANGGSTCNNVAGGVAANRSAYWITAMLDGLGNVIKPDYFQVYYKRNPAGSDECKTQGICVSIPNGLRFIFGYDMIKGAASPYPGHFHCEPKDTSKPWAGKTVVTYDIPSQAANCPLDGNTLLVGLIDTPKCWDGKNLDTADHRSHLAARMVTDAAGTHCPATHPFLIPQFTLGAHYRVMPGDNLAQWSLSSDAMHPELKPGNTFHADYFEAWDVPTKIMWTANCIDKRLNCSAGEFGNGQALRGAGVPAYGWTNPNRVVPLSSIPRP